MNAQDNTITIKTLPGSKIALLIKNALERSRNNGKDDRCVSYYHLGPFTLESAGVSHDEVTGTFRIMHEMVIAPEPVASREEPQRGLVYDFKVGSRTVAEAIDVYLSQHKNALMDAGGRVTVSVTSSRLPAWMAGEVPVPMRLTCPTCGELHIDEGEFATKIHHTHACQKCGVVWRPAVVATIGVRFLPGFKDEGKSE